MSLWAEIIAGRLAAGRLWPPRLSLDMMGRDWASFTVPLDFDADAETNDYTSFGTSWQDFLRLYVCYPDSWDADATYAAELRLDIYMQMRFAVTGGATPTVKAKFEDGDNEVTLTTSSVWYNLYKTYASGLPTGPTSEMIDVQVVGATPGEIVTVYSERAFGERGPDSFYQFRVA